MKPLKQCQRLILFLRLSAEKAAKSVRKQHKKGDFSQPPNK
ncbi:Fur family transcriptional regulator [Yersinia rochesterensis]|uniref:Fur family transcriptional regulator n=1 Tax=Yersinia rochesterensis TaxID=1604335 RepID=A0A8D4SPR3_9GAMM|nr:Fur family transcriptional regulator [Yersinia rochesterensis]